MSDPFHPPAFGSKPKFEATADELKRLDECMTKPEFRDLLREYMDEISNPKTKHEYEAYLSQLEREEQLPPGTKFIRPTPGYCFKLKSETRKLFVNVCHSNLLDPVQSVQNPGERGQHLRIPFALAPARKTKDSKGAEVDVFDFAVNERTFQMAKTNERINRAVVETALDAIESQLKTKLPRSIHLMKSAFFGGEPPMMTINTQSAAAAASAASPFPAKLAAMASAAASSSSTAASSAAKPQPKPAKPAATPAASTASPASSTAASTPSSSSRAPAPAPPPARPSATPSTSTPKHSIVHRGEVDMADYTLPAAYGHVQIQPWKRPVELVATIELPLVSSSADIELDIAERRLVLTVPGKYALDFALPYAVDSDRGKAKFIGASKKLTVSLPVLPPSDEERAQWRRTQTDFLESRRQQAAAQIDRVVEEEELAEEVAVPAAAAPAPVVAPVPVVATTPPPPPPVAAATAKKVEELPTPAAAPAAASKPDVSAGHKPQTPLSDSVSASDSKVAAAVATVPASTEAPPAPAPAPAAEKPPQPQPQPQPAQRKLPAGAVQLDEEDPAIANLLASRIMASSSTSGSTIVPVPVASHSIAQMALEID